jgi:GT2 family glycosyltransferase
MISILLPCYKSEKVLAKVFRESVFQVPVEIVCYDNGGNGNEPNRTSFKWIGDGRNIGLNAALNACAREAKYDYFYLCHTDMLLMPGWDTALIKRTRFLKPDTFLFCSRSIEKKRGHTPFHIIKDYGDDPDHFQRDKLLEDFKDHSDHSVVTGYRMPFLLHRKLWDKMGGVDENYFSYATDNDLFMSAYDAGIRRFWMVNQSLIYHLQGQSNSQQKIDKDSDAPYAYFRKKWSERGYNTKQHIDDLERSLCPWNLKIY